MKAACTVVWIWHKTKEEPPLGSLLLWGFPPQLDSNPLQLQAAADISGSRVNGCRRLEEENNKAIKTKVSITHKSYS